MPAQRSSGDLLADRRYRYAEACLAEGDASGAAEMAEQTLERAPGFAPAWVLLGRAREHLYARSGDALELDAALAAYRSAGNLDPDGTLGSQIDLARLVLAEDLPALSPAYVQALFDGYAARFERHLVDGLSYRGPALIRAALPPRPERFAHALDLGCGTGLMGEALGGRVGRLTGVDLSPAMLALARTKGCYQRLVAGDLTRFLAAEPEASVDLCLAADVFIYLGDLAPVLAAIARVLRPDGYLAFTVQSHAGPGAILGGDGRYAHADAHVADAATGAGLATMSCSRAAVRRERGIEVPGRVVVLGKGGAAG